jgi:hypothetical protein
VDTDCGTDDDNHHHDNREAKTDNNNETPSDQTPLVRHGVPAGCANTGPSPGIVRWSVDPDDGPRPAR